MKQKLSADDIVILGEGPQIKRNILEKYGSVKLFYETRFDEIYFNENQKRISLSSLRTYLSKDIVYSDIFKRTMANALLMNPKYLILNEEDQIKRFVDIVDCDTDAYSQNNDMQILKKILSLAKSIPGKHFVAESAVVKRSIAQNYLARNYVEEAIELQKEAIEEIKDIDLNRFIHYSCELGKIYSQENMDEKADYYFDRAKGLLSEENIKNDILFRYYYWRGKHYLDRFFLDEATALLQNACNVAHDNEAKTAAIQNIGLACKKGKKYQEAINIYDKALEMYGTTDLKHTASVLNNKAMVYLETGDLDKAEALSSQAIEINRKLKDSDMSFYRRHILYTHTITKVRILKGDIYSSYDYMNALLFVSDKLIDKSCMLPTIVDIIESVKSIEILQDLAQIIQQMLSINAIKFNDDYVLNLKACIGDIYIKINNERSN